MAVIRKRAGEPYPGEKIGSRPASLYFRPRLYLRSPKLRPRPAYFQPECLATYLLVRQPCRAAAWVDRGGGDILVTATRHHVAEPDHKSRLSSVFSAWTRGDSNS